LKFYSNGPHPELKETRTGFGRGLQYEIANSVKLWIWSDDFKN
jgi:hypothetical protein